MEVHELVQMGFVPKPREPLDKYLESGKKWHEATNRFKYDLIQDSKRTLKKGRVYVPKKSSIELIEIQGYNMSKLSSIGISNPQSPIIRMGYKDYKNTYYGNWVRDLPYSIGGCLEFRYKGVKVPIGIVTDKDLDNSTIHESSHCTTARLCSKKKKDIIFNERIAYELVGLNAEKSRKKISESVNGVKNRIGIRNMLALAHRTTRPEFMGIYEKLKTGHKIHEILKTMIEELPKESTWRWELLSYSIR